MKQTRPPSTSSSPSKNEGYGSYGNYGDYGGYGGYGGYYYGYGYGYGGYPGGGEGGGAAPTRTVRDYMLILRERIWYVVVTFFVIFTAFVLYALNKTPEYVSQATVQVYRFGKATLPGTASADDTVANDEDFNTRVRLMQSETITKLVAERLQGDPDKLKQFLAPFQNRLPLAQQESVEGHLMDRVSVTPVRASLLINVSYEHPDKEVAANIANYYADAFISFNQQVNARNAMNAVDDLQVQANQEKTSINKIQEQMKEMVEKYGQPNLDPKTSVLPGQLQGQNSVVLERRNSLDAMNEEWRQVQEYEANNTPLWNLSFIQSNPRVAQLLASYDTILGNIAGLSHKLGAKHPDMIQAVQLKDQTEQELKQAVNEAAGNIQAARENAQNDYNKAQANLDEVTKQIQDMGPHQVEYDALSKDLEVDDDMYKDMIISIQEQKSKFTSDLPNTSIVDHANIAGQPSEPKVMLLICAGLVGGLVAGVGMAFLVAYLDDRIKTAMDIEAYVGLPLLGILPRIRHLNPSEKAQAVASNADRRITEAFRSIYSTLKLNDAAKNARAILVTSTVPSEGKSFVTTNLALTYAMHGERVIVIDCDLRMPNVAKSMGKEAQEVGLMTHLLEGRPLEECLIKDFYPNLDLLTTGGKTSNPTQIFNSPEFTDFIAKLRQQYDRIFIDSPPVGAVSDALNLLSNVDGVLYIIKFNSVKRKTAKLNIRRLMEGNVPIFGAILNQISLSVASYYYTSYYDKSYHNYYMHDDEKQDEGQPAPAATAPEANEGEEKN